MSFVGRGVRRRKSLFIFLLASVARGKVYQGSVPTIGIRARSSCDLFPDVGGALVVADNVMALSGGGAARSPGCVSARA
ncbi:hypothetical protein GUJ93_ZPchr0013g36012 [Zizania palustris]|uniref:Secreted protein n=1 Tax=Zizania palustris TaxID=103762 RepID=A0A8J5X0K1_ZIZPA|nr:hypothetical protein GUJ93_ZPchr0013g36012 [Zizania palustris]